MARTRHLKVGDVVRIRGDLIAGLDFEGIHIFADQAALFGTCGKVREIDGDAVRVGRWWWHRKALEPEDNIDLHDKLALLREVIDLLQRENEILRCYA